MSIAPGPPGLSGRTFSIPAVPSTARNPPPAHSCSATKLPNPLQNPLRQHPAAEPRDNPQRKRVRAANWDSPGDVCRVRLPQRAPRDPKMLPESPKNGVGTVPSGCAAGRAGELGEGDFGEGGGNAAGPQKFGGEGGFVGTPREQSWPRGGAEPPGCGARCHGERRCPLGGGDVPSVGTHRVSCARWHGPAGAPRCRSGKTLKKNNNINGNNGKKIRKKGRVWC